MASTPAAPETDPHLMESLLPEPLPEDWTLKNGEGGYYAEHPEVGRTGQFKQDNLAAVLDQARTMTRQVMADGTVPPVDDPVETRHGASPTDHGASPTDHGASPTDHGASPTDHGASPTDAGAPQPQERPPAREVVAARTAAGPAALKRYDGDAGETVELSQAQVRKAHALMDQVTMAYHVQAVAVHRIKQEKLHLALGHETWKGFCRDGLGMSRMQVHRLCAVGAGWSKALPDDWSGAQQQLAEAAESDGGQALAEMGIRKLHQLTRLGEDLDLSEVASSGVVQLKSGGEMSVEELRDMTVREVTEEAQREKKALRERADVAEAEKEQAQAERDLLREREEDTQKKYTEASRKERLYGPAASRVESKTVCLDDARAALNEFARLMKKAAVTTQDDDGVQGDCFMLLNKATDLAEKLEGDHAALIAAQMEQF